MGITISPDELGRGRGGTTIQSTAATRRASRPRKNKRPARGGHQPQPPPPQSPLTTRTLTYLQEGRFLFSGVFPSSCDSFPSPWGSTVPASSLHLGHFAVSPLHLLVPASPQHLPSRTWSCNVSLPLGAPATPGALARAPLCTGAARAHDVETLAGPEAGMPFPRLWPLGYSRWLSVWSRKAESQPVAPRLCEVRSPLRGTLSWFSLEYCRSSLRPVLFLEM